MNYKIFLKTGPITDPITNTDFYPPDLELSEVIGQSPLILLGVTDPINQALQNPNTLNINTVYDLGLSAIFNNAARIVDASTNTNSVINKYGTAPSDIIDQAYIATPLDELPNHSILEMSGVGTVTASELATALGYANADECSIRDLAYWPPFIAAKKLIIEAYNPYASSDYDPEAPDELIPRTGKYPTQKVFYKTTVLLETHAATPKPWDGHKLDITSMDEVGFNGIGFGAILTFSQSWFPKAVALGQLLHSLPLAPGESTKIAVIDWLRKVTSSTMEDESQSEQLSNAMNESTAISEVTSAVAREHQEGSSTSSSNSTSANAGFTGLPVPAPMEILFPNIVSVGASGNASNAATYTTSSSQRSVSAQSQQNIVSRTQQNSALTRNKRASIVSEVSQSESENINTRTVTNYNHMHALSIQYYEVVQIYETVVELHKGEKGIQRCVFIPMSLINFRIESNIKRYYNILIRYALDRKLFELLLKYRNTVIIEFPFDRFANTQITNIQNSLPLIASLVNKMGNPSFNFGFPDDVEKGILLRILVDQINGLRANLKANYEAGIRNRFVSAYDKFNFTTISLNQNALFTNCAWELFDSNGQKYGITDVKLLLNDGRHVLITVTGDCTDNTGIVNTALGVALSIDDIKSISVNLTPAPGFTAGSNTSPSDFSVFKLSLQIKLLTSDPNNNKIFWLNSGFVASRGFSGDLVVMNFHSPVNIEDIEDRLMEDQLYYSQKIWLSASTQSLIMQLAPFTWTTYDPLLYTINIVDYIDSTPVGVAGNYLIFKFTYETDSKWINWKKKEGTLIPDVNLVTLPSGGVFAEAVLGEFNSAEKLDVSRFWKWQDSPIPFIATDINPIEAGKHALVNAPTPGKLPDSLLSLQQPLPLPGGLATSKELLGALTASNIFRDMSGNEITTALLKASLKAASEGDTAAMAQANDALNKVFEAFNGLVKTAAGSGSDVLKTATDIGAALNKAGLGGALSGAGSSISGLLSSGGSGLASALGGGAIDAAGTLAGPILEALAPLIPELAGVATWRSPDYLLVYK